MKIKRVFQNHIYKYFYEYYIDRISEGGKLKKFSKFELCDKYLKSFSWIKSLYYDGIYNDWVFDAHYAPPI